MEVKTKVEEHVIGKAASQTRRESKLEYPVHIFHLVFPNYRWDLEARCL